MSLCGLAFALLPLIAFHTKINDRVLILLFKVIERAPFWWLFSGSFPYPTPALSCQWFFTAVYFGHWWRRGGITKGILKLGCPLGWWTRLLFREGIFQAFKLRPLNLANFGPVLPVRWAWGKCSWILLTFGFPVSRSLLPDCIVCVVIFFHCWN